MTDTRYLHYALEIRNSGLQGQHHILAGREVLLEACLVKYLSLSNRGYIYRVLNSYKETDKMGRQSIGARARSELAIWSSVDE